MKNAVGPLSIPCKGKLMKSLNPKPRLRAKPPGAPSSSKEPRAQPVNKYYTMGRLFLGSNVLLFQNLHIIMIVKK